MQCISVSIVFASPRRPQFWKKPLGTIDLKTDLAIQNVWVHCVCAIFVLALLVSPDNNLDFLAFGMSNHNVQHWKKQWMQHLSLACFTGDERSSA